jgi:rhomboid family GlyGly-CTERM serine protease
VPTPRPTESARTDPVTSDPRAWWALSALLAGGALLGWQLEPTLWNWRPDLALQQPWRWWTAALVHLSAWHLAANLAGLALVAALGRYGGADRADALAWAIAWPLTHLALLLQPSLHAYGGLSGVLHAGVVIIGVRLALHARGPIRITGLALLAGVALKLLLETPWQGPLRHSPEWDFAVAPGAHLAGAGAGAVCALVRASLAAAVRR